MNRISDSEIQFIKKGLKSGFRLDGRHHNQIKSFKSTTDEEILKTANGACKLKIKDNFTILAGIKAGNLF